MRNRKNIGHQIVYLMCSLVIFMGITSCSNTYDADIESLRAEIAKQKEMIEALQNQVSINDVVHGDNFCTLYFSNGETVTLQNIIGVIEDGEKFIFTFADGSTLTLNKTMPPLLKSLQFMASDNPEYLVSDVLCEISGDVVECMIPHIVQSKHLVPQIEFNGVEVQLNGAQFVGGVYDFSKPVELVVVNESGDKTQYTVNVRAFTGLPIVYINTENNAEIVSKDDYLNAKIRIVEDITTRASGDEWESEVRIKGRGNSTWGMPKKPYKLKFNEKVSLLGEPKDKEWVLLANYTDKSAIRNELAFFMGRMSSMLYTCRTHFVDLVLNNRYVGTYQLGEQLKISEDRVNVGDDGFLLEIDGKASDDDITFSVSDRWWSPINIKDPDVEVGDDAYNYIVDFIRSVDKVLYSDNFADSNNGYAQYIDVASFVDWYLINEISRNNDASFYTSCYMHHKPGDKLYMGPLWDFDIAFGNENYAGNESPYGFYIKNVLWYARLFQDPAFVAKVKERFDYFYTNKDVIFNEINENAQYLRYSVAENNAVWKTLYKYTWPNYAIWGSYENEVAYLKQWLSARLEWLKKEFDAM